MNWFLVNTNVKPKYRQSILQKRSALSSSEVSNLSKTIIKNADLELNLSAIKTLGSYFSAHNEVDLEILTNKRFEKNLLTTFPKVGPNHSMHLIATKNLKKLSKNKYDIFEPSDGHEIYRIEHEIIIIPTVGVDKNGYRLGYGGGFYDKTFAKLKKLNLKFYTVGFAFDEQKQNKIPIDGFDYKLDFVLTEKQLYKFI